MVTMKELNKEFILTTEAVDELIEELAVREEMSACKGNVIGIKVCGVN